MPAPLNITKVAVGCADADMLRDRHAARAVESGGESWIATRFRPKREGELVGGSVYWIVKHRLIARQEILGFADDPDGRRCRIRLSADIVPISAMPRRAHQGWRYLPGDDAPADLGDGEAEGLAALPSAMVADLAALALI